MTKIPNINDMEKLFLDASSGDDIFVVDNRHDFLTTQDGNTHMSADDVRHDTAVFGRILINAYCGWPFHTEIVKRRALKELLNIYNNAADMTAREYFESLRPVISDIPDCHIMLRFQKDRIESRFRRTNPSVGKNITDAMIKTSVDNGIAIIGFAGMYRNDHFQDILLAFDHDLKKSRALIIDLRGNSGGNSFYSDQFAYRLLGAKVASTKRIFVRKNPDARKLWGVDAPRKSAVDKNNDTDVSLLSQCDTSIKFNSATGYNHPIYILTDCITMSAAEMFVARMKKHPLVKLVGENTAGGEVYGNLGFAALPHSRTMFAVGNDYRELEYPNFETNGFAPDIRVAPGDDAMRVAMADIKLQEQQKVKQDIKTR